MTDEETGHFCNFSLGPVNAIPVDPWCVVPVLIDWMTISSTKTET